MGKMWALKMPKPRMGAASTLMDFSNDWLGQLFVGYIETNYLQLLNYFLAFRLSSRVLFLFSCLNSGVGIGIGVGVGVVAESISSAISPEIRKR